MSDLFALLSRGSTSLAAHRASSAVASHNLQNANTPGFARQRAELAASLPASFEGRGYIGRGVTLQAITQARDRFIERQMSVALGQRARSSAHAEILKSVSALDPDATAGLTRSIADFYASLRQLGQSPGDLSLRQAVIGDARKMAMAFNRGAASIEGARTAADAQLEGVLQEATLQARTVAELNVQIRNARAATGSEPNDLLDTRQRAVDRLAELVGGTPVPNNDGDLNIMLPGGASLVSGSRAGSLTPSIDAGNGGHFAVLLQRTDGTNPATLPNAALGGKAGGLLEARDGALLTAARTLDSLAFDLATAFNTVHAAGYAQDGTTGHDFFSLPAASEGAAAHLAVNPALIGNPALLAAAADMTAAPGDGRNLHLLVGTESASLSNGVDVVAGLAGMVAAYGHATRLAQMISDHDDGVAEHLATMRESISGVSIDEELVNLTKAQRAFEATSKVITTANEMLDTLMKIK